MKFADPRNDIAFKKIFGDENKKEILISFLNSILNFSGTPKEIVDITIKNPYQVKICLSRIFRPFTPVCQRNFFSFFLCAFEPSGPRGKFLVPDSSPIAK